MELFRDSLKWNGSVDQLSVKLGNDFITEDPGQSLNRPLKSPENFDWQSEYGLAGSGNRSEQAKELCRS